MLAGYLQRESKGYQPNQRDKLFSVKAFPADMRRFNTRRCSLIIFSVNQRENKGYQPNQRDKLFSVKAFPADMRRLNNTQMLADYFQRKSARKQKTIRAISGETFFC